jgi:hypothetical protein
MTPKLKKFKTKYFSTTSLSTGYSHARSFVFSFGRYSIDIMITRRRKDAGN